MSTSSSYPGEGQQVPVPLSALEHYAYCPRQAGLILLEDAYADDVSTVRGTLQHQRVHELDQETRPGLRILRALPVWNDDFGLIGVCDVVEIYENGTVVPIEHKSGNHYPGGAADVQVAGQAMCLETMFQTSVPQAVIYSGTDHRRHQVAVDQQLRRRVAQITHAVRDILTQTALPAAVADTRCRRCSMRDGCMPHLLAGRRRYADATAQIYRLAEDNADN